LDRIKVFEAINKERDRQESLHPIKLPSQNDSEEIRLMKHYFFVNEMLSALIEEVGEVGKALQGEGDLEEELIQVASLSIRWLEYMKEIPH
jgi:hypothetical protein